MAKKYAIVVDVKRCIGCASCSVACKLENNVPDGVWYNTVETIGGQSPHTPAGSYGNCTMTFTPINCMHCDNPACVEVCPTGATYVSEGSNIVLVDNGVCIGCKTCMSACPYAGVRTLIDGDPVSPLDFPVGSVNAPSHLANTVEKCTMCNHRLAQDMIPACVEGCPARARFFGDLNDPESEVSKLLAERAYTTLLPEEGTNPNVYYLS